jgi:hypothetical protein
MTPSLENMSRESCWGTDGSVANALQTCEQIVPALAAQLTRDYGGSFAEKSLRRMVQFAATFPDEPIVATLSRQLSWSHFVLLLPLKDPPQREYYAQMSCAERWSVRTLRGRIDSMLRQLSWSHFVSLLLTGSTQVYRLIPLRAFFKWLSRENHILFNPASELELPCVCRRLPAHILSRERVGQVMALTRLTNEQGHPDAKGLRDRAVVETSPKSQVGEVAVRLGGRRF